MQGKDNHDLALWSALKKGDKQAVGNLFDKYVFLLYNYGLKIVDDYGLIEDSIQDVFMELWKRRTALSHPPSVKHYLFKSLRRRIYRKLNQQNRFTNYASEEQITDAYGVTFSYEAQLIIQQTTEENQEKLRQVMDTLSEKQKTVIFLKFYDRLSYEEIAAVMSLSVKAVYDLMYHTIKALRKHFQKAYLLLLVLTSFY